MMAPHSGLAPRKPALDFYPLTRSRTTTPTNFSPNYIAATVIPARQGTMIFSVREMHPCLLSLAVAVDTSA